jgi:hypothetical protein
MVKILVFIIPLVLAGFFIFVAKNSKFGNSGSLLLQGFVVLLFIGGLSFQGVEVYRWMQYEPKRIAVIEDLELSTVSNKSPAEKEQFISRMDSYLRDVDTFIFMRKHMPSKHKQLDQKLKVVSCLKKALSDKTINTAEMAEIEKLISE